MEEVRDYLNYAYYASGIFPLASYFNHSCEPNCQIQIDGVIMSVYANKVIKPGI